MTHHMPRSLRARIEVCLSLVDVHTGRLTQLGRQALTEPARYPIAAQDLAYATKLALRVRGGDDEFRNNVAVNAVQYFSKVKP